MGRWVDDIARALAAGGSRRQLIRVLGAAALGAAFAGARAPGAVAQDCKAIGKACKKGEQCCSGNCVPPTDSKSTAKSGSICCPAGAGIHATSGACCTPTTCAAQGKDCGSIPNG